MNERYEQLLAQAHIEFAPDSQAVTKRFAELIVRECVDIIQYGMDWTKYDDSIEYEAQKWCRDTIKERFGVEE
jgi:hypothetical protein